jgi:hypothetical protein
MPENRLNMRLDRVTARALAWLTVRLNLNTANVIRLAVVRLAHAEGMPESTEASERHD